MDLTAWFRQWFSRHPLKEPTDIDHAQYTAEVMERIKTMESPAPQPARRVAWSRWPAFWPALAGVAACAAIVVVIGRSNAPPQLAQQDEEAGMQQLAALDGQPLIAQPVASNGEGTMIAQPALPERSVALETELPQLVMLAKDSSTEDQWIEETLLLLDALGEELPEGMLNELSDDEWLEQLDMFDDADLFAGT